MIKSLVNVALEGLLKDKELLKNQVQCLPQELLYKLVDLCIKPSRKVQQLILLIQRWPFKQFTVENLFYKRLDIEVFTIICSVIQSGHCAKIQEFDFVGKMIWDVEDSWNVSNRVPFTNVLLKLLTQTKPILSSHHYVTDQYKSVSYSHAFKLAHGEAVHETKLQTTTNHTHLKQIDIIVEIVATVDNIDSLLNVLQNQMNKPSISLHIHCIRFEAMPYLDIIRLLRLLEKHSLYAVDLSFNSSLSLKNHLNMVCEELEKCHKLQKLSLAYNVLTSEQYSIVDQSLSNLTYLRYLDLSANFLFKDKNYTIDICSLTSLILSNCLLNKDSLKCFLKNCKQFSNLRQLNLNDNPGIGNANKLLVTFISKISGKLQYLDISSCNISAGCLEHVCECFEHSELVNALIIWPNNVNEETTINILCCQCGTPTPPNPSNMCIGCIRSQVDITEGIQKQAYLQFCKGCERYFQPPNMWVVCQLESKELLALCLKKLKGINKAHLIDAGFVWTEPHSKRIKVKLTVQKENAFFILMKDIDRIDVPELRELNIGMKGLGGTFLTTTSEFVTKVHSVRAVETRVLGSTILQQTFIVEFIVQGQMCDDCHRREAKDFWKAVVQVRQKVLHKKTFYYLEQLIIKHNIHSNCLNIKQVHEGLDFYYAHRQHAKRMVDFLNTVVPSKMKQSERLISHDIRNNTYNYKNTYAIELVPICKNDIVCLPVKVARSLGNISQISICSKIATTLHFVDPFTGKVAELSGAAYWRNPFLPFTNVKNLTEYTVIDVELNRDTIKSKYCQADVYLMKNHDDIGSDVQIHCRTHLGHLLKAGDTVSGLDFTTANLNDDNLEGMKADNIPDVVLVKKKFGDRKKRSRKRNWRLKELPKELTEKEPGNDYEDFLEDLEEDKDLRSGINIYKDHSKFRDSESESGDIPRVGLEEMLDDLKLEDEEMASDEED